MASKHWFRRRRGRCGSFTYHPWAEPLEARAVPSFMAVRLLNAGYAPHAVAVGDFNGDGVQDLAVADNSGNTVNVLLGNGDGSFGPAHSFATGSGPASVAVGDFNGDSILDLAVANDGSGDVSVLLGNGDGSFQAAHNFPAGSYPQSVAVGDFNGDGHPDLVVANNTGTSAVTVLLGNGDGSFQAPRTFSTGKQGSDAVAVGDFNGDGHPDVAVAENGSGGVSILLGNGDGSFQAARYFVAGTQPMSVAVSDLNGDGIPDLAVADSGDFSGNGQGVSVLLGNGDGSFQAAQTVAAGTHPAAVAVADFNGDGKQDLAVTNAGSNGTLSVLLGNGDGSFGTAATYDTAGSTTSSLATGDLNGDGVPDLVSISGSKVGVFLANPDGSLQAARRAFATFFPNSVVTGDFNSDGIPDLAVGSDGGVDVLLGNGDGSFGPATYYKYGARSLAVGDFNGDGIPDLATLTGMLLGNGDGSFRPGGTFRGVIEPARVAVGDFNGDGIQDVAVLSYAYGIKILLGNGDGSFQPARTFNGGGAAISVGDFNGDGIPDLAVPAIGGRVQVFLGNGDGTFQPARTFAGAYNPTSVVVGDLNGDGHLDLVETDSYGEGSKDVWVLLGNGDGTFRPAVNYAAGSYAQSVALGDLNGDGIPDLAVVAGHTSASVSVLLGNGDGSFQPSRFNYSTGGWATSVAVGDFNGDGWPDLAVTNYQANDLLVLRNDGLWENGGSPGGSTSGKRPAALSVSTDRGAWSAALGLPGRLSPARQARPEAHAAAASAAREQGGSAAIRAVAPSARPVTAPPLLPGNLSGQRFSDPALAAISSPHADDDCRITSVPPMKGRGVDLLPSDSFFRELGGGTLALELIDEHSGTFFNSDQD